MFEQKPKQVDGPGTIVGANVKLSGTLKDSNDITVHGQVEGEVISEKNVTIEQTARIKGPINASLVIVAGEVSGEITAKDKLEILETGIVKGSISTNNLIIKSGATFNGKCNMKQIDAKSSVKTSTSNDSKKSETNLKDQKNKKYELE